QISASALLKHHATKSVAMKQYQSDNNEKLRSNCFSYPLSNRRYITLVPTIGVRHKLLNDKAIEDWLQDLNTSFW
ncbi:MAG: hypothetical protein ACJ70S_05660, partial [Nitrososphaera sp.]